MTINPVSRRLDLFDEFNYLMQICIKEKWSNEQINNLITALDSFKESLESLIVVEGDCDEK